LNRLSRRDGILYAYLTVLVWGLTAPWRGLWQDDTIYLSMMIRRRGDLMRTMFGAIGTPMRRLYGLPAWLASITPRPILTLHLLYGAFWVGHAFAAGWIVSMLLPRRPLIRFAAIVLTLTATSDYLTSNLTAIGYNFAILTLLLAIGSGLRFASRGGVGWLIASAVLLTVSVWTIDLAFTAIPFVPFLLLLLPGASRRRSIVLLAACAVAILPAVIAEWMFLHDSSSYAAKAILPLTSQQLATRMTTLWLDNFTPWRWVFSRQLFGALPPLLMPRRIMAALSACAAIAVFVCAQAQPRDEDRASKRPLALIAVFCVMTFVCNAVYGRLHMADLHYRTHVMSRVWASLAIAIAVGWAAERWPRARPAVLGALAVFVGLGAWGGLERQDLFLSTWQLHQRELLSILESVPALRGDPGIILRSGDTSRYLATEAGYLSENWLVLLYDRKKVTCLRLTPKRGTGCRSTPSGLDCWRGFESASPSTGQMRTVHFDYDNVIVLDYDEAQNRYGLVQSLVNDPLGAGAGTAASAYQPERLIERRPLSANQRHLLLLD
jgi:hypothetical protein